MLRDDKITEIMTLAGVAPDDFDDARRNYKKLSDLDIDSRLARLRTGAEAVDAWRAREEKAKKREQRLSWKANWESIKRRVQSLTGPGVPLPLFGKPLTAEPLSAGAWSVGPLSTRRQVARQIAALQRIDRHYATFIRSLNARTSHPSWANALRPLPLRLAELITGSGAVGLPEFLIPRLEAIASRDERAGALAMYQLNEFFKHPFLPDDNPRLTATGTIDALARVENVLDSNRPDVLVVVNEGQAIGSIIAEHLGLHVPMVRINESPKTGIRWMDDPSVLSSARTVCVMGHFARTGDTLRKTMNMTRAYCPRVYGAVLVCSVDALDNLRDCAYHQLVTGSKVDFTFDLSKGIRIEDNTFILSGRSDSPGDVLPITRIMLNRSRLDMQKLYPVDASFAAKIS
jgi:hypothetical protein